ncbi:MAG: tetratricopeptide repeat-containing sensor histidine kinase [Melioribacteraceae bacterium]|nr:tetratricopeptide repeat-containing sensor histidine kinase [Melioribacteraceae bacterium]
MKNRVYTIYKKSVIICFILIVPLSAILYQDKNNQINLFPNMIGTEKIDSLNNYILSFGKNNPDLRMEIGRKCYELSKKENYKFGLLQATYNIGASFFHQSYFDSALTYYKEGYKYANSLNNLDWKMNFETNIGQVFSNKYHFDSANVYYSLGMESAKLIKDTSAVGYLYNSMGAVYWKKGEFLNAIKYYKLGLKINREQGNYNRVARSLNSIGSSYWNLKNNILALEYYLEALEVQKYYLGVISPLTLNNIALLYLELNDIALAEKYVAEGLKNAKLKTSILGEGYSYLNMGDLNFKKKKYNKALEYYNKAITFYEKLKDKNGIAQILNKIGEVFLITNQLKLAEKKFLEAYEISEVNRLKLTQTESLINYCRILLYQNKNSEVRTNLDQALQLAEEGSFAESKLKIFELKSEVYEKLKDYKTAILFQRKYVTLKDSLFNEKRLHIFSDTKEKYEAAEKEKRNSELQHINEIQILELESQEKEKLYVIALSIFSLFVIIYLTYLNTQRKKRNTALQKANNEVKIINEKLNETNKLLQKSNSTKDKFFSIISHDLKNPFNTLLGASEILQTDFYEMTNEENKELIDLIAKDSQKLYALLENLLYWANSQTGELKANRTNILLNQSISEIVVLFSSSAKEKNISIDVDIPESLIIVFDKFMFSTVIRNLLSNAIKFTNVGGKILFVARELNGIIELLVIDEGVGIEENNLQKLFDESSDYRELGTNDESGTGLGLILCRDFVKENSSKIEVSSKVGKGTTFKLILEKPK